MKKPLSILFFFLFILYSDHLFSQCGVTLSTSVTNVTCYNGTTGSITVTPSGGTAPYQYQLAEAGAGAWGNGNLPNGNIFSALSAATYPVSVKDATGCISTIYVTVNQPSPLSVTYHSVDPTCSGSSNGSLDVSVSGGTAPYSYSWKKDETAFSINASLTGLSTGNYLLVVTDVAGCTTSPVVSQQIKTISVSGFTQDVIANGTNTAANASSTIQIDQNPGNLFYAGGYSNSNGTGSYSLPASGNFNSAQDASRPYQLASYSANNALLLHSSSDPSTGGVTSGTFTFASQNRSPYEKLYVLGTTGSGTGVVDYTVHFSDGGLQTGSLNFPDWYLSPSTSSAIRALGSLGRVTFANPGTYDASGANNFNLWEAPVNISGPNQSKTITSIDFSWSSSSSSNTARIALFAVTGYTSTTSGIRINDGAASDVTPSVSIVSDAFSNQFCNMQNVTFTATPVYGGSSPSYQWYKNNSPVSGATASAYSTNSLGNNDEVKVVMTAGGGVSCLATNNVASNIITMTTAVITPAVSVSASSNNICSGSTVTFTATPVNGGTSPSYQWYKNGSPVGGAISATYSSNTLNNNDQVNVQMTSSIGCASPASVTGTPVTMTVTANGTPSITISSTPANPGVNFAASGSYEGSSPVYQWYKNGSPIGGATSSTYAVSNPALGELYSLKLTSDYACATVSSAMSNYITITSFVLPVTLESFTVRPDKNGKVILTWKTSMEYNNKQFIIQRATGTSNDYRNIAVIAATNLQEGDTYNYTDVPALSGVYQYRLIQQDIDGHEHIAATRSVIIRNAGYWFITDKGKEWVIQSSQPIKYALIDMQGRLVEKGIMNGTKSILKPLGKSIYILHIEINGETSVTKLLN